MKFDVENTILTPKKGELLMSPVYDKASTLYFVSHMSQTSNDEDICKTPVDVTDISSATIRRKPLTNRRFHSFRPLL